MWNIRNKRHWNCVNKHCNKTHADQIDDVAICSPSGPVLANIFLGDLKKNGFLKTTLALRFGFDTLTIPSLIDIKNTVTQFLHYLNNCHGDIKLTVEFEDNSTIPFLDMTVVLSQHLFTERRRLLACTQNGTPSQLGNTKQTTSELSFRCFHICSSPSLLRSSLNELRKLLSSNGYAAGASINYNINDAAKQS